MEYQFRQRTKGFIFILKNPKKIINYLLHWIAQWELITQRGRVFCQQARGVKFSHPNTVRLQQKVVFDTTLNPKPKIMVGKNVIICRGCIIIAHQYDTSKKGHAFLPGEVIIGSNVFIGTNSTIICSNIGDNAVIGAGTTIYKDVPSNAVVVGPEQRIVKMRQTENISEAQ